MRISKKRLRKLITEEIAVVISQSGSEQAVSESLKQRLAQWLGCLRATHMWFHAAHHVVSGAPFAGDHGVLYDRIYVEIQEGFDADVEKAIGVTSDESVACPIKLGEISLGILKQYPSPVGLDAEGIAHAGLELIRRHVAFLEEVFSELESQDALTLGLNDHLAAQANTFETYVYLLQQRTSTV